jgi:hypothetical protein
MKSKSGTRYICSVFICYLRNNTIVLIALADLKHVFERIVLFA